MKCVVSVEIQEGTELLTGGNSYVNCRWLPTFSYNPLIYFHVYYITNCLAVGLLLYPKRDLMDEKNNST